MGCCRVQLCIVTGRYMTESVRWPNLRCITVLRVGNALLYSLAAQWLYTEIHVTTHFTASFWLALFMALAPLRLKWMTVIGCQTHEVFHGCVMMTGGNFLYVQYMFLPFKIKERSSPGFRSRSSLDSITQITNSCINSLLMFPCHGKELCTECDLLL